MSSNLQLLTPPQGEVTFGEFVSRVAMTHPETGRAYMGKVSFSEGLPGGYNEGTMTVTVLSDGLVKYTFNSIVSPYSQYECYSVNGGEPTGWNEGSDSPIDMNEYNFIKAMVMPSVNSYGNMLYIESPIDREFYYRLKSADESFDYCDGNVYEYGCEGIYSEPIPLVGDTNVYLSVAGTDGTVAFNVNTDPRYEYALNMRFNTIKEDNMRNVFGSWVGQFNYDLELNDGWRSAESGNYNYVMYAQQPTGGTWPNSFTIDDVWVTGDDYVGIDWANCEIINTNYNLDNPSGTRQVCYPIMLNSESNIGKMFKVYDWLYENWDKIPSDIKWLDGEEPMYEGNVIVFNKIEYVGTPYLFGMLCYIMLGITNKAVYMWNNTVSVLYGLPQKPTIIASDMNDIYVSFTYMVECLKEGRYKVVE